VARGRRQAQATWCPQVSVIRGSLDAPARTRSSGRRRRRPRSTVLRLHSFTKRMSRRPWLHRHGVHRRAEFCGTGSRRVRSPSRMRWRSPDRSPRGSPKRTAAESVHRDIKPRTSCWPHGVAKVTDFVLRASRDRGRARKPPACGDVGLHVTRTGPGPQDRCADRRVVAGLRDLRDAHRPRPILVGIGPGRIFTRCCTAPRGPLGTAVRRRRRRWRRLSIGACRRIPAAIPGRRGAARRPAGGGCWCSHCGGRRPAPRDLPSIAVLPFADMSPDKSQGYFAEGIAEELIHALARIRSLRVVARTSLSP